MIHQVRIKFQKYTNFAMFYISNNLFSWQSVRHSTSENPSFDLKYFITCVFLLMVSSKLISDSMMYDITD